MSWASSNAPLVIAVSNAGGMGVIAAGPMRPEDFQKRSASQSGTAEPFGVNIPLNNKRAELARHRPRGEDPGHGRLAGRAARAPRALRAIGTKWLHVVAGARAQGGGRRRRCAGRRRRRGGRPSAALRGQHARPGARVFKATKMPVVASGGVADGAGIAALLGLGADAVQLGTRFIATPEASVHEKYKAAVLEAEVGDTTLVGRGAPIRVVQEFLPRRIRNGRAGRPPKRPGEDLRIELEEGGARRRHRMGQGRGGAERGAGRGHRAGRRAGPPACGRARARRARLGRCARREDA